MGGVVIGVDPHKRSATIEVLDEREKVLATGRFGTDTGGYRAMLAAGRWWPDRAWAVEGCSGVGRYVAQRLVADGELVVDVPAKLSARARVFPRRAGPQDRRHRRSLDRRGRPAHPGPADRPGRRRHGGVAAAGRPPRRARRGPRPDREPAAPAVRRPGAGRGEQGPDRAAGP